MYRVIHDRASHDTYTYYRVIHVSHIMCTGSYM